MGNAQKSGSLNVSKKAQSLVDEFRNFALKGNVIDLAVAVVIGGAFGRIIDSLVKLIIMPLISLLLPAEHGYLEWRVMVGNKEIPYGIFIGEVVNLIVIALALFIFIVKFLGWVMRTRKAETAAPPKPSREEQLLTEIRDLLKTRPA